MSQEKYSGLSTNKIARGLGDGGLFKVETTLLYPDKWWRIYGVVDASGKLIKVTHVVNEENHDDIIPEEVWEQNRETIEEALSHEGEDLIQSW